jgi:MoaA/NifB/PqqE/SkfB family radical SAM enzyme
MKDYYCNQKFYQLKINAEKKVIYSCCRADQEQIDINWLKDNPGEIFNTPNLIQERKSMLSNERIPGCENTCWSKEDKGMWSRRLQSENKEKITTLRNKPTQLDITLSSECNLSCSYCCKQYSSTWRKDIEVNGDYNGLSNYNDRYALNNFDRVLKKLSQKKRQQTTISNLINTEIDMMADSLESVTMTGGEPLLDHRFSDIIKKFKNTKSVAISSGLGVSESVLRRGLEAMSDTQNKATLSISAESIGKNFEFNRQGSNWETFLKYIDIIKEYDILVRFHSTYSNLNITDFVKFNTMFYEYPISISMVYDPAFMSVYNLDDETKKQVIDEIKQSNFSNTKNANNIINTINEPTNETLRQELRCFLKEFTKRRKISIDYMPESFTKWVK